jgi:sulfite exporter TauE/SafE
MALPELAAAALGASLLGSPHCAGMCGGFVCFVSGEGGGARRWIAHAAYHVGRLASYAGLGAAAGSIGAGAERMGLAVGVGRLAPILAGALLIVWGASNLVAAGRGRAGTARPSPSVSPIARTVAPWIRALRGWPPAARGLAVGLLTTLIPCGFLYSFVAVAGGTGSPLAGMGVMAVFWIGTVPILAGLGLVADRGLHAFRARAPFLSAAILIALGVLTLSGRLAVSDGPAHHPHRAPAIAGAASEPEGARVPSRYPAPEHHAAP